MDYKSLSIEELVRLCAKGDSAAWIEFDRRFSRLIGNVVIRICRYGKMDYVEDCVNETYIRFLKNDCALLVRFKFEPQRENAFLGYLKRAAISATLDFLRKLGDKEVPFVEGGDPPDRGDPEAKKMVLFFNDVDHILRQPGNGVPERDRTIFWLYYRQGLTCKEIASIPAFNLSVKGVESVIHRLTEYVRRSFLSEAGD